MKQWEAEELSSGSKQPSRGPSSKDGGAKTPRSPHLADTPKSQPCRTAIDEKDRNLPEKIFYKLKTKQPSLFVFCPESGSVPGASSLRDQSYGPGLGWVTTSMIKKPRK